MGQRCDPRGSCARGTLLASVRETHHRRAHTLKRANTNRDYSRVTDSTAAEKQLRQMLVLINLYINDNVNKIEVEA